MTNTFLVADVGGTNTRITIAPDCKVQDAHIIYFKNSDATDLYSFIETYIAQKGITEIQGICVDIAGPVLGGVGKFTNLDWTVDPSELARRFGSRENHVINDMQAQGYALPVLPSDEIEPLFNADKRQAQKTKLVVNIGTGFNAAPVHFIDDNAFIPPSEAGHYTLPVQSAADLPLSQYLTQQHGFAAVEDVLSGRAIENIYNWLNPNVAPKTSFDILADAKNKTDAVAQKTAQIMAETLGVVCSDLALAHLPMGGIYLVGGAARALAPFMNDGAFWDGYTRKGRFAHIPQGIAVSVVNSDTAALYGNAAYLQQCLGKR